MPAYSYDLASAGERSAACDARAHRETWQDMVRRQERGVYPAAFSAIEEPVLMLHGVHDPHPGRMIRDNLLRSIPQLAYQEWRKCGHYPWLERAASQEFYAVLRDWLARGPRRDTSSRA
jgi:pimeloyl-ACP methyl ester carboxylesterase